ncbi:MAG: S8 family serine peptidase [Myxococcota bacterium]
MKSSLQRSLGALAGLGLFGIWASAPLSSLSPAPNGSNDSVTSSQTPSVEPTRSASPSARLSHTIEPDVSFSPTVDVAQSVASPSTWIDDQVLIRPHDGDGLAAITARWSVDIVRQGRESGLVVLTVPDGLTPAQFIDALGADDLIQSGHRHARIVGASDDSEASDGPPVDLRWAQWHLDASGADNLQEEAQYQQFADLSSYVIAVLDTGVAYEDAGTYRQAPSLAGSPIVAPYDFVNADPYPYDDHQHGTHIASVIASDGAVQGIAPGVGLMPLKVLDEENSGYEIDLIEAIYHAVDNGADVINMSLSFGLDYVPSQGLLGAIAVAEDAGVIMVAASGNDGSAQVSWPARSPTVIAVGSHCGFSGTRKAQDAVKKTVLADYSNNGTGLDVTAPGGCLDEDFNGDGIPDGVIGETISLQDPGQIGYWAYAGTSQAAAQVSGMVVWMLNAGAPTDQLTRLMHDSVSGWDVRNSYVKGRGAGPLHGPELVGTTTDGLKNSRQHLFDEYAASLMPYLIDHQDGTVSPAVDVLVLRNLTDDVNGTVYGRMDGSTSGDFTCNLNPANNLCTFIGDPVPATTSSGEAAPLSWQFSVEGFADPQRHVIHRLQRLIFASEGMELAVDGMAQAGLNDAVLAFHWEAGTHETLGPIAESYMATDNGTGIATSPFTVLMTPPVIQPYVTVSQVDLGGTGIATSPFTVRLLELPPHVPATNVGLPAFPSGLTLAAFDGTGIATSPFTPIGVYTPPIRVPTPGTLSGPVLLGSGTISGEPIEMFADTALGQRLLDGGWVTLDGQEIASSLGASTLTPPVKTHGSNALGAIEIIIE